MESINTTSHSTFFNQNNVANNYYYDSQENIFEASQTAQNYDHAAIYDNVLFRNQQPKRTEVSLEKLEKLRKLQDKVDKHEAEKESLVNQIYDLRQLLQRVNKQGESKLVYIKNKNAKLRAQKQGLLQALDIARENASHFDHVSSYWSYCINSYCDISSGKSRDYESSKNSSFGNNSTCAHSHADLQSLTNSHSCIEYKQPIIGSDIIICGLADTTTTTATTTNNNNIMRRFKMTPDFSEEQEQQEEQQQWQQQLQLLQPNLLLKNKSCSHASCSSSQGSSVVVVAVVDDDRDCGRDSDCGCGILRQGNEGHKSEEEAAEEKPVAKAAVASSSMTAQQ